MLSETDFLNT